MRKMIEIGGEEFTLKSGEYTPAIKYWSLFEAYATPSSRKTAIWEYWQKWFEETHEGYADYIAIRSKNCNIFTINGRITVCGVNYTFLITPTRQDIYLG